MLTSNKPLELIDLRRSGTPMDTIHTKVLLKTDYLEVILSEMPAGSHFPKHRTHGEVTIQCLEGHVELQALGSTYSIEAGQLVYLQEEEFHAIRASDASLLLITVCMHPRRTVPAANGNNNEFSLLGLHENPVSAS